MSNWSFENFPPSTPSTKSASARSMSTFYDPNKQITMNDDESGDAQCPSWAVSLGYLGVASAVCLSNWGSAVSFWKKNSILFPGCTWAAPPLSRLEKDSRALLRLFHLTNILFSFFDSGVPGNQV